MKKLLFKIKKDTAVRLKKYDGEDICDLIFNINDKVNKKFKEFLSFGCHILFNKMNMTSFVIVLQIKAQIQPILTDAIEKYSKIGYNYDPKEQTNRFLHNIYYHCISLRNKTRPRALKKRALLREEYINV